MPELLTNTRPLTSPMSSSFDLSGEEIAHGGLEAPRHAGVPGEMVERSHGQNAKRDVDACKPAGHGVHGSVAAARHNRLMILVEGARRESRNIVSAPGDDDLRLDAELDPQPAAI